MSGELMLKKHSAGYMVIYISAHPVGVSPSNKLPQRGHIPKDRSASQNKALDIIF